MLSEVIVPLVCMVLGLALIFIEIAIVPGFGLVGIAGGVLLVGGAIVVWSTAGAAWGLASLLVACPLFVAALWIFFKSGASNRLVQHEKITGDSSAVAELTFLSGRTGVAKSPLRPSGIAEIEGKRYDVVTDGGEYVEKGEAVVVVRIDTNSIVVEITEINAEG